MRKAYIRAAVITAPKSMHPNSRRVHYHPGATHEPALCGRRPSGDNFFEPTHDDVDCARCVERLERRKRVANERYGPIENRSEIATAEPIK